MIVVCKAAAVSAKAACEESAQTYSQRNSLLELLLEACHHFFTTAHAEL
jgi:hypothetical protein